MSDAVLDASAVLAALLDEPGGEVVAQVANDSAVSAVNLTEVISRLSDRGYDLDRIRSGLARHTLEIVGFDLEQAMVAGMLRPATRSRGLSLGDRACLALAYTRGLPVLTADHAWEGLDVEVEVRVIR